MSESRLRYRTINTRALSRIVENTASPSLLLACIYIYIFYKMCRQDCHVPDLKISNIKLSFTVSSRIHLDENSGEYLFYTIKHYKILKLRAFTFTFMGREGKFINLTGVRYISYQYFSPLSYNISFRSLQDIKDALKCFKKTCEIDCIYKLKIDTMACVIKRKVQLRNFPENIFMRKYHKRFPATTIKHASSKISANIFPSCIVLMGLKCLSQANLFIKYI